MRRGRGAAVWASLLGGLVGLAGGVSLLLSPLIGSALFGDLWAVEPLAYIGAVMLVLGLGVTSASLFLRRLTGTGTGASRAERSRWSQVTQHYFELFDHDLGRPLRRILGKEREVRALLQSSGAAPEPPVGDLLSEIERQAPSFRLMMGNVQVLVQLESPDMQPALQPVEPAEIVRKIVERYTPVVTEAHKEVTWWAEPPEFGIVYADGSAIEHILVNLVDNAVRFARSSVEVKVTRNPTHFFVRVRDDGPGIPAHYLPHIFDRGWTPEVARREEKSSSGLGLFIARTLARRHGGDLTVESVTAGDGDSHTAFLLALPLQAGGAPP